MGRRKTIIQSAQPGYQGGEQFERLKGGVKIDKR